MEIKTALRNWTAFKVFIFYHGHSCLIPTITVACWDWLQQMHSNGTWICKASYCSKRYESLVLILTVLPIFLKLWNSKVMLKRPEQKDIWTTNVNCHTVLFCLQSNATLKIGTFYVVHLFCSISTLVWCSTTCSFRRTWHFSSFNSCSNVMRSIVCRSHLLDS